MGKATDSVNKDRFVVKLTVIFQQDKRVFMDGWRSKRGGGIFHDREIKCCSMLQQNDIICKI